MLLFMRYLPILALVIGLAVGYKVRDASADKAYERLQGQYTRYQLKATELADKASKEALARQQAQELRNQELGRAKADRDNQVSVLQRDLNARLRDVRLCHARARPAHRVPQAADRSAAGDPEARPEDILPASTGESLVELAADADRIVNQLEMCQSFVKSLE